MRITIELRRRHVFIGLAVVAGVGFGYVVGARAAGIPQSQPLFVSGVVEENGALAEGLVPIGVKLFDDAVLGGAHEVCDVNSLDVDVAAGRFRIDVSDCLAAVRAHPDVFVEVNVRGQPLPRTKIGAVPFAVEADRATLAVNATEATHASSADVASGVAAASIDAAALAAGSVTAAAAPFALAFSSNLDGGEAQPLPNARLGHVVQVVQLPTSGTTKTGSASIALAGFTDLSSAEAFCSITDGLGEIYQPSRCVVNPSTSSVDFTIARQDDPQAILVGGQVRLEIFVIGQ